jgi:hypothetical protein
MAPTFKQLTDFLLAQGADDVAHSGKSYLAHNIGVYRYLKDRGCSEELCRAGMFHSIYGTELFQRFSLPVERRPEVRELIGERAERLAYANCAMDRATFDGAVTQRGGPYRFRDRLTGETIELSAEDFDDLCRIHLYDWLEQAPRSQKWDYRREAYRNLADRLGGIALNSYEQVFAGESAAAST